jgi:PhnB protein
MTNVNPYLMFDGRCREAFEFYEKLLGGKITGIFPHAGTPAENSVPPEWREKIMHVSLKVGNTTLMGSDAPPQHQQKPQGFSVNISADTPEEAERIFGPLSEGGVTIMPIAETFWARRFGMCIDRFGIPWMINCEKPM